jgi:hypothetical protein
VTIVAEAAAAAAADGTVPLARCRLILHCPMRNPFATRERAWARWWCDQSSPPSTMSSVYENASCRIRQSYPSACTGGRSLSSVFNNNASGDAWWACGWQEAAAAGRRLLPALALLPAPLRLASGTGSVLIAVSPEGRSDGGTSSKNRKKKAPHIVIASAAARRARRARRGGGGGARAHDRVMYACPSSLRAWMIVMQLFGIVYRSTANRLPRGTPIGMARRMPDGPAHGLPPACGTPVSRCPRACLARREPLLLCATRPGRRSRG